MAVYCIDCENVHPASRDEMKPWQWRCLKWPRPSGYGFVHPSYSPQPPYHSCREINSDGRCADFYKRKPQDAVYPEGKRWKHIGE